MNPADTEALKALVALAKRPSTSTFESIEAERALVEALPALERMLASQTQDMVLVPREPTDDMLDALRGWGEGPLPAKLRWEKALRIAADTFPMAAAPVASQMGIPRMHGALTDGAVPFICTRFHREVMYYGEGCPMCQLQESLYLASEKTAAPAAGMDADKIARDIVETYICTKRAENYESSVAEIAAIIRKHVGQ